MQDINLNNSHFFQHSFAIYSASYFYTAAWNQML